MKYVIVIECALVAARVNSSCRKCRAAAGTRARWQVQRVAETHTYNSDHELMANSVYLIPRTTNLPSYFYEKYRMLFSARPCHNLNIGGHHLRCLPGQILPFQSGGKIKATASGKYQGQGLLILPDCSIIKTLVAIRDAWKGLYLELNVISTHTRLILVL